MSGPNLQLGVGASGIETVEKLNRALDTLEQRLRALPAAASGLQSLQAAVSSQKGLNAGSKQLVALANEVKVAAQSQATALADLAETIRKGYDKAAQAKAAGEAKLSTKKPAGESGIDAFKAKLMVGSAGIVEQQARQQLAWVAKMQAGSLKIAEAIDAAAAKESAARLAWLGKMQAGSVKIAEAAQAAAAKENAARFAWSAKMQLGSLKIQEAAERAADKESAARFAWSAKMQLGSVKIAESMQAAAEREERARLAWIAKMQAGSLKIAEAARAEAAAIDLAMKRRDAAFAASSQGSQARTVLGARSQLDQGVSPDNVRGTFGNAALAAAQATSFEKAYQQVHAEVDRGAPKFKRLTAAMNDAHSAARGLASGFGAMFLTWGNLGPLLAGAALSHSFVQSIKIGAQARQELETIRVLSEESSTAVAALERQLVSLGERGPFGPAQVSEAMRILSLAGLSAQQVSVALEPALQLAITGGVGIEKAAESLVAIGTAYGFQAEQFGNVGDIISKAAAVSMSSVDGMMESFRSSSVVAQQYKVSLTDTATALALLANVGIQRSAAGTAVRQMFSELSGASRQTREAMKRLKVDIIDTTTGGFRPLLDIVRELDASLAGLDARGRQRAIQDLSNERGAKSVVALLEALQKKSKESGSTVASELERINRLVVESHGFMAISAAQLAATPQNMMKAVASSFQTSLFEAFKSIEPTIIVISATLRQAFSGNEFRSAVAGLASSVANLTVFLVQHAGAVKNLVLAYIAYKGAMLGATLMEAAVRGLVVLVEAYRALRGVLLGTAAANAAVAASSAAAATGITAVGGAASTALRFLGPIGMALGVVGALWAANAVASQQAAVTEKSAAEIRSGMVIESLDKEIERLKLVEIELRKGTDARLADIAAQKQQAAGERLSAFEQEASPLRASRNELQARLQANPELGAALQPGFHPSRPEEYDIRDLKTKAEADARALDQLYLQFGQREREIKAREAEVRSRSRAVQELRDAQPRQFGTEGWDDAQGNKFQQIAAGKEFRSLKTEYDKREQTIKQFFDQEQQLLDLQLKYKLTTEAEHSLKSEAMAKASYDAQIANLQDFIEESASVLKTLDNSAAGKAAAATLQNERAAAEQTLDFLRQKTAIEQQGRANKSDLTLTSDLAKLQERVDAQERSLKAQIDSLNLSPAEVAAARAKAETESSYTDVLRKKREEIERVQKSLDLALAASDPDSLSDPLVERLQAEVQRLRGELDRITTARDTQANRSGSIAAADPALQPQWRRVLDEWNNTVELMRKTKDDFMLDFIQTGESTWMEFMKTGKLNLSNFGKLIEDTFHKLAYRRFIAPAMEGAGNWFFNQISGAMPSAGSKPEQPFGDVAEKARGLGNTFDWLKSNTTSAGQGITSVFESMQDSNNVFAKMLGTMGSGFSTLLGEIGRGMLAMLQSISGGSGGGIWSTIASAIASYFGGGGGGMEFDAGTVPSSNMAAKGLAFDTLHSFAKGGSFTNQLFDRPTLFSFAKGTKIGQMGEEGIEAVMPLERGPGGRLGVRNWGAGAGGAVAPKTTVLIENHTDSKPQVTREKQPNGDELVKIVLGKMAQSIASGGQMDKAIRSTYGLSRSTPRFG